MTSQLLAKNKALAHAVVDSELTQRRIAKRARIDETRLSRIISGQLPSTPRERKAVARVLGKPEHELFPEASA